MEERKEESNSVPNYIKNADSYANNNAEISQQNDLISSDINEINELNVNETNVNKGKESETISKINFQEENNNEKIKVNNQENTLQNLTTSIFGDILPHKLAIDSEEEKDIQSIQNEKNSSEASNSLSSNHTNEKANDITETDDEIEYDAELKNVNEVTLVNVITETDPISLDHEKDNNNIFTNIINGHSQSLINDDNKDHNSNNEPTFQTDLDNPNATKRPSSSLLSKRTTSTRITNRTRKVITARRPSTASGLRSDHQNSCENYPNPNEEDLHSALDLMIQKRILPNAEIRPEVINYARKIGSKKMLEELYDEAAEIDLAIDIMFTSIEEDRIKEDEITKKAELQSRIDQTINKKKATQDKYIEMINDEQNRYKEKYDEIIQRHALEVEKLKIIWQCHDRIKNYNKPSSKLFQMRKQQKSMALVHDFQGAKQMKKMADQLEKQEAESALAKIKEAMKIEYQQLLDKQQKELSCLKDNHEKNINTIKMSQGKDEELVQNTMQLLKFKLETSKTAKKPKLMVPVPRQRPTTCQSVPTTGMITYRTRNQLNNFRKESNNSRLPLKLEFSDRDIRRFQMQSQ